MAQVTKALMGPDSTPIKLENRWHSADTLCGRPTDLWSQNWLLLPQETFTPILGFLCLFGFGLEIFTLQMDAWARPIMQPIRMSA